MQAPEGDGPHAFAPVPFEILGDSSQRISPGLGGLRNRGLFGR